MSTEKRNRPGTTNINSSAPNIQYKSRPVYVTPWWKGSEISPSLSVDDVEVRRALPLVTSGRAKVSVCGDYTLVDIH